MDCNKVMTWRSGLLLLLATSLVGTLSVVSATRCPSCSWTGCSHNRINYGVCSRSYYTTYSYTVSYRNTVQRSTQYTTECDWGWGRRCTRTRYWTETETAYRRAYGSRRQCAADQCCSGWYTTSYSPRTCEPPCSGGCRNGGTCIDVNTCLCTIQWTGHNCENHNANCTCDNGGTCIYPDMCDCTPGWMGPSCRIPICSGGCLNGGLCVRPDNCSCPSGWIGTNCETDINECATNTSGCDHNCTNTLGFYFCTCQDGFTLSDDNHNCTDINECNSTDKGGCDHNCSNTLGSYNCSCNDGFVMLGENNTCIEVQAGPEPALGLDNPGVATVSGVAVSAIVASVVLCVVVAIVVKLRAPLCQKAAKDKAKDTEPTPEDYGGFELSPNPAYGEISYVKSDKSLYEEVQPAKGDDGNVYVSNEREPPAYENLTVLY